MLHKNSLLNHKIENYTYATAAARTSATGFVTADLGKVAYQTDEGSYWRLTATTPTWAFLAPGQKIEAYTYASTAARTGATGFLANDIGKIAFQSNTATYWRLTATTPTWQQLVVQDKIEAYTYANAAARTGASGFITEDLGKIAYQTDAGTYWRLTATTPTWVQIGSSGAGNPGGFFNYAFNTTTANDPSDAQISFNNATFGSVTQVAIDSYADQPNLISILAFLQSLDDGTAWSTRRALIIGRNADLSKYFAFYVNGVLTGTGHPIIFPVTPVSGGFVPSNGEAVTLLLMPLGEGNVTLQNIQNGNYTFALSDAIKHVFHSIASAHTYTIPANASVAFPVGTRIMIVNDNNSTALTLAITTDTLRRGDGTAGTGSRTIPPDAIAEIVKTKTTEWMVHGVFT